MTLVIFKFVDIFSSRNRLFYILSHNYTIVYSDLVDEWHSLYWFYLVLFWQRLKRLWSEADLMLGSSRLAGFGPLRAQGTMTASLYEWSHGGHVTQRGYCVTESTPPQIL